MRQALPAKQQQRHHTDSDATQANGQRDAIHADCGKAGEKDGFDPNYLNRIVD